MLPANRPILAALILTLLFVIGLVSFLNDYESEKAEMTYMFEFPQFVRITNEVDMKYKRFGLYAYSEGQWTEKTRRLIFDGIPVLFIPGSAGSHKQCRSLASIALRKAVNSHIRYHFDYFTVDLNNEMSGLYGPLLSDQLEYANASIATILKLYVEKPATKIIIIGHSMGGVLAKAIVSQLPKDSQLVPIVVALAAPLRRPVLALDYAFAQFYSKMNANFSTPENTSLITVAGGFNDFLVPAHLAEEGDVHAVGTQVPRSWVSTDHLSIVWCKQLLLAVNRALFDSVNVHTKQVHNKSKICSAFHHHLVHNSGTKVAEADKYNQDTTLPQMADWYESANRQFSVRLAKGTDLKWYLIPLVMTRDHEFLTLVGLNIPRPNWVYICTATLVKENQRTCRTGNHLTQLSQISPSLRFRRRNLHVNLHDLKMNYTSATHVAIKMLATDDFIGFQADICNSEERKITYNSGPSLIPFYKSVLINETEEKAIFYEIILPQLTQLIQSYTIYLDETCTRPGHHATASLIVPWNHHELHKFHTDKIQESLTFKLYKAKPAEAEDSASIRLTLDPTCRYRVKIQGSYDLGMFARFYSPMIIAYLAAVLLMMLHSQLMHLYKHGQCTFAITALKDVAKPYLLIPVVKILAYIFDWVIIPPSDASILADENMDFFLLPLILYSISTGILWLFFVFLTISLVFFESTLHKLAMRVFLNAVNARAPWTKYISTVLEKVPGLISGILVAISYSSCGGLAISLAAAVYYIKLLQLSQNFIEDLVKRAVKYIIPRMKARIWSKLKPSIRDWLERRLGIPAATEVELPAEDAATNELNHFGSTSSLNDTQYFDFLMDEDEIVNPTLFEVVQDGVHRWVDGEELLDIFQSEFQRLNEGNEDSSSNANVETESTSFLSFSWIREAFENNEIFFHMTIFSIYFLSAMLNIPSVLTWARNYKYNKALEADPVRVPAMILSICTAVLWQLETPRVDRKFYSGIAYATFGAAALTLIYGVISIYRITFILTAVVAAITAHQVLAPSPIQSDSGPENGHTDDDTQNANYQERVRSKWD